VTSAVPPGTRLLELTIDGDIAVVNFSRRLLAGQVDDVTIEAIFRQVKWTLWNYGIEGDISILVEEVPLADFAPPTPVIEPGPGVASLSGYSCTVSPGHGIFWNGYGWYTQRPVYCSPLNQEDYHNLENAQYLETYLANDSMTVKLVRSTNKSYGNHYTGNPWWKMAAYLWLQHKGYPCSVYGSYSGCTTGSGGSEINDDIRARPLASDYDNTTIYISLHTNGYQGDCTGSCPTGSDIYYDCSSEHASWCTVSQNLATNVNNAMLNAIQTKMPDSNWVNRGIHDSNGAYGEIRIPNRAAILIELGFHDTCDHDAVHLQDNFFRSTAMWGIYKGVCDYFGKSPAWDYYSDQLVSHDIPTQMYTNEQRTVHITFRNKGVLWNSTRAFKLGAVGDSDPFTSQTRHTISGEVGPNGTYTFTFTLTAPGTPGNYLTDWRMLRESVTWFGATASRTVQVTSGEVIVDNVDSAFTCSGSWYTGTMASDKYGTNYRWHSTQPVSDPAKWQPSLPSSGNWNVYAWWTQGSNRDTSATYIVFYTGGSQNVYVNQQTNGGQWNLLGTWNMSTGKVWLSCWRPVGKVVIADAVKWS